MAVNELAALGRAQSELVAVIQERGDEHFRSDAVWRNLPHRVRVLELFHQNLVQKVKESGLDQRTAASFSETIKHATEVLDGEVVKVRRSAKSHHSWGCCGGLCRESVDVYLQAAEAAYRKVSENLNLQLQSNTPLGKSVEEGEPIRLPFRDDECYVARDDLEGKIYSALKGSAVVLLSGGPGKGKSALARQMCLRFEKETPFIQPIMLECGPNLSVASKRTELLRMLGGHSSQQSQALGANFNVSKGLEARLRDQKSLVVLDDLWEPQLLYSLVNLSGSNAGSGAKWLITSQNKSVCDSLNGNWVTYEIEDLSHEEARKILASHAGFEDKNIPPRLQKVADEIIRQVEANSLVLAILGAQIANAGREIPKVWESVLGDHFAILESGARVNVHGVTYPRSFMVTMKRSIDLLTLARKHLLVLIGMCRTLSVSKHALHFLYYEISKKKCSPLTFATSCNDLQSRHLLAENENQSLRIHSLTKEFILDHMQDCVKAVESLLIEASFEVKGNLKKDFNPSKTSVTLVLADLFIEKFHDRARARARATQSGMPSHLLKSEDIQPSRGPVANMECKSSIIESISELLVLVPGPSNEWTEELGMCAQKVILEFVEGDCLAEKSISQLLGSSRAVRPVLNFLKNVCLLEKSFWKGNSIDSIPQPFLNLLRDDSCPEVQERAASVLADLCWSHKENSNSFASAPGMLSQLALFLSQVQNSNLQKYAARVLAAYAYWDYYCDGSVIPKVVAEAGLVDSLVDLLAKEENRSVQIAAGHALCNLATAKSVDEGTMSERGDPNLHQDRTSVISGNPRDELAKRRDLLELLTNLLGKSQSPVVQVHACSTLVNIAGTDEIETLKTLLNFPGLVDKLVSILNEDPNPRLQEQAARALGNLATYRDDSHIRRDLLQWPGLVEGLAKLLRLENPSLQRNALSAFSHLAFQIEKDTANGLIDHPGLVESLMMLSESQNSNVQAAARAVSVLCSLTDVGDDSLRARIASSPPFLAMLTKSIVAGETRAFEADIVCLIANLAVTSDDGVLDNIAKSLGLVQKLTESLGENQNSSLQGNAIRALLNLAGEENNDDIDVSFLPDLLQRLQQALLRSERLELRKAVDVVTALTSRRDAKETEYVDRGAT